MTIIIDKKLFFPLKKELDGFVFWKKEGETHIIIKQICPNKKTEQTLSMFPKYLK